MDIVQIEEIKKIIKDAQKSNHFIAVDFIKKTTGESRHMVCHRSKLLESTVSPYITTSTKKRNETLKANNILKVEEIKDGVHQFRSIPLENVTAITYQGVKKSFN